jgi:acetate---CoA ligase (ADP-forming)
MISHRLDPLLRPRSLALVGASARPGSVGNVLVRQLVHGGFRGRAWAVNPRGHPIEGLACVPTLAELPEPVEHVVLAIADERAQEALEQAIERGARAVTVLGSLNGEDAAGRSRRQRFADTAHEAGVLVCGAMSMGFHHFDAGTWVGGFRTRPDHQPGAATLITQSGSVFSALLDAEDRLEWNLAVSSGQELTTTAADYLDYALDLPSTRVVGMFLESIRDPDGFRCALDKAQRRGIPIVAIKVGRSRRAAAMSLTHSGALVGADAACQAVFEHHGVIRVESLDRMAATLMMFAQPRPIGPGGLATVHDSGGERALLVDLAEEIGVPFAPLAPGTRARVQARLDDGLEADNPLDAWGSGHGYVETLRESFHEMMRDPAVAVGAVVADRAPGGATYPEYRECVRAAAEATGKPVFLVSPHAGSGGCAAGNAMSRSGHPLIDGMPAFLLGVRDLFRWRDDRSRGARETPPEPAPIDAVGRWRRRLGQGGVHGEAVAFPLVADFGIPVVAHRVVQDADAARAAAMALGYPVALKALVPGLVHKSEAEAVVIGIRDRAELDQALAVMLTRFGPPLLVARSLPPGPELLFGVVRDSQFGPVVTLGAGGVHAEWLRDSVSALPPFGIERARSLLDRLRLRPLLDARRGRRAVDLDTLARAASRLSVLAHELGEHIESLDINPIIAGPHECAAVDALLVASGRVNENPEGQVKEAS